MFASVQISTPYTESWVAWLMLGLLVLLGVANIYQPGFYVRALRSLPTTKERDSIFMAAGNDYRSQMAMTAFGVIVVALLLRWLLNAENFTFTSCAIAIGCVSVALLARKLMQDVVAFVFFERHELDTVQRHYRYINNCLMITLFPLLLLALYTPLSRMAAVVMICVLMVAYMGFVLFKIVACLPLRMGALFYIPLYVLTVEILPIAGMIWATQRFI